MSEYSERASNYLIEKRGWGVRPAVLAASFIDKISEQVIAVVPITVMLLLVMGIFFQRGPTDPGYLTLGILLAIFGLTLFLDALRIAVLPLGELLGRQLPHCLPLWGTLSVACLLGMLCTYAEPAIASLRPLAALVVKAQSPYLYLLLNDYQEILVFSVALGVGFAAVLGIIRFVYEWSLKPFILACLVPTIALSCYMHFGNPDLMPVIGLAWDLGGVTTGPVTVPILLALGIGVMKTSQQQQAEARALQGLPPKVVKDGPVLEGFGIITLASLMPILMVQIFAVIVSLIKTKEEILAMPDAVATDNPVDKSPFAEIIFAIRAILPLNAALIFLVKLVLRQKLPVLTIYESIVEEEFSDDEDGDAVKIGSLEPVMENDLSPRDLPRPLPRPKQSVWAKDALSINAERVFKKLDLEGSGSLAAKVLVKILRRNGLDDQIAKQKARELIGMIDEDSDMSISLDEFVHMLQSEKVKHGEAAADEALALFDDLRRDQLLGSSLATHTQHHHQEGSQAARRPSITPAHQAGHQYHHPSHGHRRSNHADRRPSHEHGDLHHDPNNTEPGDALGSGQQGRRRSSGQPGRAKSGEHSRSGSEHSGGGEGNSREPSPSRNGSGSGGSKGDGKDGRGSRGSGGSGGSGSNPKTMRSLAAAAAAELGHLHGDGGGQDGDGGGAGDNTVAGAAAAAVAGAAAGAAAALAGTAAGEAAAAVAGAAAAAAAGVGPGAIGSNSNSSPPLERSASMPSSSPAELMKALKQKLGTRESVKERPLNSFSEGDTWPLFFGVLMGLVGMMMFNLGLTWGFTSIGSQIGNLLPSAFLETEQEPNSPRYSYQGGTALTLATAFMLGFLATKAEPALNVLGFTVEKLSEGNFTRMGLVYSVCMGVSAGLVLGSTKILFSVPIIYFILIQYSIALVLTYEADDDFTCVAWDSAGVTTGPVTVPFVLSIGVGFSTAVGAPEGFGILTNASVAPIISVLIVDFWRRHKKEILHRLASSSTAKVAPQPAEVAMTEMVKSNKKQAPPQQQKELKEQQKLDAPLPSSQPLEAPTSTVVAESNDDDVLRSVRRMPSSKMKIFGAIDEPHPDAPDADLEAV